MRHAYQIDGVANRNRVQRRGNRIAIEKHAKEWNKCIHCDLRSIAMNNKQKIIVLYIAVLSAVECDNGSFSPSATRVHIN